MLEKLSSALKKATDKIANAVFLDKNLVDQVVKDLQRALIEADVNVALVLQITQKIKKAALDERIAGLEKKEHIIKLLHDELVAMLGEKREVKLQNDKNVFMMIGLYGQGKTTTISKLASYYAKRGHKVCAVGLDVHRPAAAEQLKQLCEKLGVACFINPKEKDPKKILQQYASEMEGYTLVILDTAGRDALSEDLIKEIKGIAKLAKPTETFLVMSADVGQTAKKQAVTFKEAVEITGVIITKMDSTAKAGGALTACAETKAPVIFIGTGEKAQDLEPFNPESFLSRLLGMGDLASLMEKIHSVVDKDKLEATQKNLEQGKLSMTDFIAQLDSMSSMGSMDKLLSYIPGMSGAADKIPKEALEQQEQKMKRWKSIYNSMSAKEKEAPELLEKQTARMQRIAKGSGTTTTEIRSLLKQYKLLQEMIKSQSSLTNQSGTLDQKTMMKLAKKFGRKMKM
jgi:signal recognition particle subunit SRP54